MKIQTTICSLCEKPIQGPSVLLSVCCMAKIRMKRLKNSAGYYNAKICSKCGMEIIEIAGQCDGREFMSIKPHPLGKKRFYCKGGDGIFQKADGKFYVHRVRGYGEEWDEEVEEKL